MQAIEIINPGSKSRLSVKQIEIPQCNENELLVKVSATAVNRADILQRLGKYPPPKGAPITPGLEIVGEIVTIGDNVNRFKKGDYILGLVAGGGYAEYCIVHAELAIAVPKNYSDIEAAALPEALVTAHATLFEIGQLQSNETLLIHGAGSGIASLAIQMAKLVGARVITTVSTKNKAEKALALGADNVINYKNCQWADAIQQPVHIIIDFIGGDYFSQHLMLLEPKGRLVQIACMAGHRVACSLLPIIQKSLHIEGFVLRSQSIEEKTTLWQSVIERWMPMIVQGKLKPIIDSVFNLGDIEQAHERMLNNHHFGKIVIKVAP